MINAWFVVVVWNMWRANKELLLRPPFLRRKFCSIFKIKKILNDSNFLFNFTDWNLNLKKDNVFESAKSYKNFWWTNITLGRVNIEDKRLGNFQLSSNCIENEATIDKLCWFRLNRFKFYMNLACCQLYFSKIKCEND